MKSKFRTLGFAAAFGVSLGALALIAGASNGSSSLFKADENHKGYHYEQNLATAEATGNAEFYACCTCHEVWLSKPSNGSFEDRAIASAEGGVNEKAKLYYVALDANGGQGGSSYINNASSQSVLPNVTVPTKTDYNFLGYYDALTDGTQYIDSSGTGVKTWDKANNFTLYAHWTSVHAYNYVAEVPATIVSTGTKAHYTCSHCNKLFVKEGDNYVETTSDALVIAKLYADWSGNLDFEKFCTGGTNDGVSASVTNGKLKFTEENASHYGEYRSLIHFSIARSHTKRFYISINDVAFSEGCNVNTGGQYPGIISLVVYNNNVRTDVAETYYYEDSNFKKLDLTDYVNKNETNDVQVVIKVQFGPENSNKKGEYVTIGSVEFLTVETPIKTFENQTYDISTNFVNTQVEHVNYSVNDGKLTLSTYSSGDQWGTVYPVGVWKTDSIENAYIKVNIESIDTGASVIFQLDYLDGALENGRKYLNCGFNAAGTYTVPLMSNDMKDATGEHFFRFRFGIQGGNSLSLAISSIEIIQLGVASWDNELDLSTFAKLGREERVSASVVSGKLRLTKYGQYHYGDFRSYSQVKVKKETNKTYKMTLSDITWSSGCTLRTIQVYYYLNQTTNASVYVGTNYTQVGNTISFNAGESSSMTVDFTNILSNGENTLSLALQMQYGASGDISDQYVEIGGITLSVE